MRTAIIIPARYGSTRFPGKPLAMIAGKSMLERVVVIARAAAGADPLIRVVVATDDDRIAAVASGLGVACVQSSIAFATGTDRVRHAADALALDGFEADFVINLQGDAPLTPPDFLRSMMDAFAALPCDVLTPVTQLSWAQLDALREHKTQTPFSGTCAVFNQDTGRAYWFSKNILPAVRKEEAMRASGDELSPVWRHIGLYGYQRAALARIGMLPESVYEKLEGLEQLRMLENGLAIRCVPVSYGARPDMTGVDSPEDALLAEALILKHGEMVYSESARIPVDPKRLREASEAGVPQSAGWIAQCPRNLSSHRYMMGSLVLCRHGNTFEAGAQAVWVGARTDLPLTQEGEAQAHRAAAWIAAHYGSVSSLVAGPLLRTRRFAALVSGAVGVPVGIDARLKEIDYGLWEGISSDVIVERYGSDELDAWEKQGIWPQSMEWKPSFEDLNAAIASFLDEERAALLDHPEKHRCAVTSNGILRLIYRQIFGDADLAKAKVKTGNICVLQPSGDGWEIVLWDEKPV